MELVDVAAAEGGSPGRLEDFDGGIENRTGACRVGWPEKGDDRDSKGVSEMDATAVDSDDEGCRPEGGDEGRKVCLASAVVEAGIADRCLDLFGGETVLRRSGEGDGQVGPGGEESRDEFGPVSHGPAFFGIVGASGETDYGLGSFGRSVACVPSQG